MSEQEATIRSVAVAAGVSMSTVSNVLSGRHEQMAVETRERVLAAIAIAELPAESCRPQPGHETDGHHRSDHERGDQLPLSAGHRWRRGGMPRGGLRLLLANAEDADSERRGVDLMRAKRVDALVVFSVSLLDAENEHLYAAQAAGMPVVAINRHLPVDAPLSAVWFDHATGGRMATQHLVDLGHRRIAHIAGPATGSPASSAGRAMKRRSTRPGFRVSQAWSPRGTIPSPAASAS